MAQDWIDDLREFGPDAVAMACGEWRRTQTKRPMPADIRLLAIQAQRERGEQNEHIALAGPNAEDRRLRAEKRRRDDIEMQRGGREIVTKWAQKHGYETIDAYAEAQSIHWSVAYKRVMDEILRGSPIAGGMKSVLTELGVRAWEPSKERLREDREKLGIGEFSEAGDGA